MTEIYFRDLKKDKQKELLEAFGVNDESDMNWEVLPVAIVEDPEDDDYDDVSDMTDDDDDCK